MNTDAREIAGEIPAGEPGLGSPKQAAARSMTEAMTGDPDPATQVQNAGDDDIEAESSAETATDEEQGADDSIDV